ncbi:MAG: amidohydrolase family protein [Humibacillus sp.]
MRIIRAGSVFDGAAVRSDTEVLIGDGGRILEVRAVQPPPDGMEVIDHGPETTLLPGLVDGHQHVSWGCTPNVVSGLPDDRAAQQAHAISNARRALAAGVTTIQDLGDSDYAVVDTRDRVRGRLDLPRIRASGPPITTPGGHCHFLTGSQTEPADVAAAVRRRAERGVDVIKVMVSGGNITPRSLPWESQFDEHTLRVLVHEADAVGIPVAAHAHGASALRTCVAVGVHAVEHCTFMTADGVDHDQKLLRDLAASGIVVRITPGTAPGGPPPPPAMAARMPQIIEGLRMLWESGARVVVSTDAGIGPGKPHDVMAYAVLQAGMAIGNPVAALTAATSLAADALGLADTCGTLSAGLAADLLVVRGKAAVDLGSLLEVEAVYRDGKHVAGPSSRPKATG